MIRVLRAKTLAYSNERKMNLGIGGIILGIVVLSALFAFWALPFIPRLVQSFPAFYTLDILAFGLFSIAYGSHLVVKAFLSRARAESAQRQYENEIRKYH